MKKRVWGLGLALCMALTGCGARTAQETPVPQPSVTMETAVPTLEPTVSPEPTVSTSPTETMEPTKTPEPTADPTPAPLEDPKEYLLARLDQAMEGEKVFMRFWLHPGSGPTPEMLSVADHGAELRELFSALDWEQVEEPRYESEEEINNAPFNQPGAYGVSIYYGDPWTGYIHCATKDAVVMVGNNGPDSVYLRADGAEDLCDRIADIIPSVYINLGRVRVPAQKSPEATLKLYLETALKRTKENGHITDYAIRAYEATSSSEEDPPRSISYTATYAFKPSHPELWANLDADGWGEDSINVDGYQDFLDYDERDGCYGMY